MKKIIILFSIHSHSHSHFFFIQFYQAKRKNIHARLVEHLLLLTGGRGDRNTGSWHFAFLWGWWAYGTQQDASLWTASEAPPPMKGRSEPNAAWCVVFPLVSFRFTFFLFPLLKSSRLDHGHTGAIDSDTKKRETWLSVLILPKESRRIIEWCTVTVDHHMIWFVVLENRQDAGGIPRFGGNNLVPAVSDWSVWIEFE